MHPVRARGFSVGKSSKTSNSSKISSIFYTMFDKEEDKNTGVTCM